MHPDWFAQHRSLTRIAALVLPAIAGATLYSLRHVFAVPAATLVFVLVIAAAAVSGDRTTGYLSAASSALWFDFFLLAPNLSFYLYHTADIQLAILMLLVGVAITELALWGYREKGVSNQRRSYISDVLTAASGAGPQQLATQIRKVLDADLVDFVGERPPADAAILGSDGRVTINDNDQSVTSGGLPVAEPVWVPVTRSEKCVGSFRIVTATKTVWPSEDQLRVAYILAAQVDTESVE